MDVTPFEALSVRYLRYCRVSKTLAENTLSAYSQDLDEFIRFHRLTRNRSQTNQITIPAFLSYLQEQRGLKPASVRRRIACLRGFFRWLEKEGEIQDSPFRDVDIRIRLPRKLPRALTRSQVAAVSKAVSCSANCSTRMRTRDEVLDITSTQFTTQLAIRLLLATGVRVGELTSIKLHDVTADGTAIRINGKGNRERTVFIGNSRLQCDLAMYTSARMGLATSSVWLLLNQRGGRLTPQGLRLRLRRISDELHISPRVTPHRFRHTAATLLIEEGLDIRLVQKLLGHSSISTTELYTHVNDTVLKSAMELADPIGKLGL